MKAVLVMEIQEENGVVGDVWRNYDFTLYQNYGKTKLRTPLKT